MTWEFTEGKDQPLLIIQRVFLPYTGLDASGNATFGLVTDRFAFDTNVELLSLLVRQSGDQWLLEELATGGRGSTIRVIAQSADLYEGWIGLANEEFEQTLENITATCGDQTYRKLCITLQFEAPVGTFTNISGGVEAIIPEISEEYPAGYGGSKLDLFWDTKDDRWSIRGTIIEEADDISQPPTGRFITEGGAVTIVEGQCTGELPPPPEPILVTTTDIQVGATTTWKWLTPFISGSSQYGSIGSFQIDGQQGVIETNLKLKGGAAFQINQLNKPNTYTITLIPNSIALLTLGGQAMFNGSYNIVSMILTITTNGDSPINTESGQIVDILGTITYEESNNGPVLPQP
jgi:RNase P/RNase MRP subunit p29